MNPDMELILHSSLTRERELLQTSAVHAIREVAVCNATFRLGLVDLGRRPGAAAWEAGNCLLVLREVCSAVTEARLICYTGQVTGRQLFSLWGALTRTWMECGWLSGRDFRNEAHRRQISAFATTAPGLCEAQCRALARKTAREAAEDFFASLASLSATADPGHVEAFAPPTPAAEAVTPADARPGRPELDRQELIRRLTIALRAEEIRDQSPDMTWKEIHQELGSPFGKGSAALKKLEYARNKLRRLQENDPEALLELVTQWRKKTET
jgi:hypothetical protein